jgi:hypothetical protein
VNRNEQKEIPFSELNVGDFFKWDDRFCLKIGSGELFDFDYGEASCLHPAETIPLRHARMSYKSSITMFSPTHSDPPGAGDFFVTSDWRFYLKIDKGRYFSFSSGKIEMAIPHHWVIDNLTVNYE